MMRAMPQREIDVRSEPGLWPPTWPMGLTMLRLLLLPAFLWALLKGARDPFRFYHWLAVGIYSVMAITDKLDGYLARRLHQTTKLGTVLDPVADKLLIACSVILLSFEGIAPRHFEIPLWVVGAIYGKDLIVALGALVLLSLIGKVNIMPRLLGKASTVLQLSMVLAVLVAPAESGRWFGPWLTFAHILWWTVLVVAVVSCGDYVIQGYRQLVEAKRAVASAEKPA